MDNPIILQSLNNYLLKKTATRLNAVSKITRYYIVPKKFFNSIKKLDTSDLAKLQMICKYDSNLNNVGLYIRSLRAFRYSKYWNVYHWHLIFTYLIYNYIVNEYQYSFIEDDESFLYNYEEILGMNMIIYIYKNFDYSKNIYYYYNLISKFDINLNLNLYHFLQKIISI